MCALNSWRRSLLKGWSQLHDERNWLDGTVGTCHGETLVTRRHGHASIKTTADVYGHLFEGQQREAASRFAKVLRDA